MTNWYDTWAVVLDDNARPLLGKIEFCEAGTTTLKTVFDDTGKPTDNPIYVNRVTTNQVMLDNGDYTIRYYRYIGNGNMESDNNESSWLLYKTELYKSDIGNDGSGELGKVVGTISELKQADVGGSVRVLGYYNYNDCPARDYVWDPNSTHADDGGVYIKSSNTTTGCWVMKVPGSYIDVRWYGDIPDMTANPSKSNQTSNLGQRAAAADMANTMGKDLYFPKGWYMFDGTNTISVSKDILCDRRVYFVVKTGTVGTKIQAHEIHKCDKNLIISPLPNTNPGGYELIADWISASWLSNSTIVATGARVGYIIDGQNEVDRKAPLTFKDCRVEVTGTPAYAITLDNVDLTSCPRLLENDVTLLNMSSIKQSWFKNGFDFTHNLKVYTCDVKVWSDCDSADDYIMLKNKCGHYNYGDLGEQELHNALIKGDALIENFGGSIQLDTNISSLEAHNGSFTIVSSGSATLGMILVDCWVTFSSNFTCQAIKHTRGALNGTTLTLRALTSYDIDDVIINCNINAMGEIPLDIKNSTIAGAVTITRHGNFIIDHNKFMSGSRLVYTCDSTTMFGTFSNNFVANGSAGWGFLSDKQDTQVNISWVNNHSEMSDQCCIILDKTNFLKADALHKYVYEGNTGVMMPSDNIEKVITGYVSNNSVTKQNQTLFILAGIKGDGTSFWQGIYWSYVDWVSEGHQGPSITDKIFMVGTSREAYCNLINAPLTGFADCIEINGNTYPIWTTPFTATLESIDSFYNVRITKWTGYPLNSMGKGNWSDDSIITEKLMRFILTCRKN